MGSLFRWRSWLCPSGPFLSDLGLENGSWLLLSDGPGLSLSDLWLENGSWPLVSDSPGLPLSNLGLENVLGLPVQSWAAGSCCRLRHGGHDGVAGVQAPGGHQGWRPLMPQESKSISL